MADDPTTEFRIIVVAPDQLEQFLAMIRDYYKAADEATYFLEEELGISNVHGIANLRDAMSHFAAFLGTAETDRRQTHLHLAEEHIRRAILEAYETGIDDLTVRHADLYERYKARLLPVKDKHAILRSAPNRLSIETTLKGIENRVTEGRSIKAKRLWETEWKEGVFAFVDAFERLRELHSTMEDYWFKYEQLGRDKLLFRITVWAAIATAVSIALGVLQLMHR
jgi:hypothetical protein